MKEKFSLLKFLEGKNYYGYDKHIHALISLLLVIILYYWLSWWLSGLVVLIIGLLKELFDKFYCQEDFSSKDLIADFCGVALGIIIIFLAV